MKKLSNTEAEKSVAYKKVLHIISRNKNTKNPRLYRLNILLFSLRNKVHKINLS